MRRKGRKSSIQVLPLIGWIALCELAGVLGAAFSVPSIPSWYMGLVRPAFAPPNWVFGPVWTTLYALMGIAAYLVWSSYAKTDGRTKKRVKTALTIFGIQLFLNATWSIVFFGWQHIDIALVHIILLLGTILWTMKLFFPISKAAAYLLVPYLLWVSFASYLNYAIWVLNRGV